MYNSYSSQESRDDWGRRPMRVLVADKFEQSGLDGLAGLGCEVSCEPGLKDQALAERVAEFKPDVLIVR